MSKNKYTIKIYIHHDIEIILSKLAGNNLEELRSKIIPTVKEKCKEKGYTDGTVFIEYVIKKDEAYFDDDEFFMSLA